MNNGKYNDGETVQRIIAALRNGETICRACELADIVEDTFYRWLKEHSEFSEEVKKAKQYAKEVRLERLEASLYKRATGYTVKEKRSELAANPMGGNPIIVKQTITEKDVAPDTAALIFALCNEAPEKWKNKQNTEHTGQIDTGITFVVDNEEQVDKLKRLAERKPRNEGND